MYIRLTCNVYYDYLHPSALHLPSHRQIYTYSKCNLYRFQEVLCLIESLPLAPRDQAGAEPEGEPGLEVEQEGRVQLGDGVLELEEYAGGQTDTRRSDSV